VLVLGGRGAKPGNGTLKLQELGQNCVGILSQKPKLPLQGIGTWWQEGDSCSGALNFTRASKSLGTILSEKWIPVYKSGCTGWQTKLPIVRHSNTLYEMIHERWEWWEILASKDVSGRSCRSRPRWSLRRIGRVDGGWNTSYGPPCESLEGQRVVVAGGCGNVRLSTAVSASQQISGVRS